MQKSLKALGDAEDANPGVSLGWCDQGLAFPALPQASHPHAPYLCSSSATNLIKKYREECFAKLWYVSKWRGCSCQVSKCQWFCLCVAQSPGAGRAPSPAVSLCSEFNSWFACRIAHWAGNATLRSSSQRSGGSNSRCVWLLLPGDL